MPAITTEDLIRRHGSDIAYVAEKHPAHDLDGFIDQLALTAQRFETAGILGHEDVETAVVHLSEVRDGADETARNAFLRRADELLKLIWEMTQEYRDMVGD